LVEAAELAGVAARDAEHPVDEDALVVGEVPGDLLDRPLPGRVAEAGGALLVHAVEQRDRLGELRRERLDRVVARHQVDVVLPVGRVLAGRRSSGRLAHATQTALTLTNSRMPWIESSRPKPECLTPPKGSRGSLLTIPLMKTAPAWIPDTSRSISPESRVQADDPSPKRLWLASAIASSRLPTRHRLATGPKISS